jgi:hypothetical protein
LSRGESAAHLASHEERVGQRAHRPESYFIFNNVADQRSVDAQASFGKEFVPVMPSLERPFLLDVGEVVIPFELRDACDPLRTHGQAREQAKRGHDDGANSCRVWRSCGLLQRRRHQLQLVDSRVCGSRHDARQVLGIREEGKHLRKREGRPVGELEVRCQASNLRELPFFHRRVRQQRGMQQKSKRTNSEGIQSVNPTSCGRLTG